MDPVTWWLLQSIKGPAIETLQSAAAASDSWLACRQSLMPCPAIMLAWCLAAAVPLPLLPPFADVALYPRPLQDTSIRRSRGRRTPPPSPASVRSPPPFHQSSPQGTSTHHRCGCTAAQWHPSPALSSQRRSRAYMNYERIGC